MNKYITYPNLCATGSLMGTTSSGILSSSATGESYIKVSTIEPLLEPNDTLKLNNYVINTNKYWTCTHLTK